MGFQITGDPAADKVLDDSAFALLAGMMLDQQYPMEHAFRGPAKVLDRFGTFAPDAIAAADPDEFAAMASTPPAIHRFPGSMASRLQELARIVEETYAGDASRLWTEAADGKDLLKRVMALPGFGKQKAQIFVALLAKQLGVRPDGWEAAVGDYALEGHRSVADVVDADSLQKVRDFKKAKKAAGRGLTHRRRVRRSGPDATPRGGPWQNDGAALDVTGPRRAPKLSDERCSCLHTHASCSPRRCSRTPPSPPWSPAAPLPAPCPPRTYVAPVTRPVSSPAT